MGNHKALLGEMKINKEKPPCDRFGFPLALNWNIVLRNQLEGKPLTQGAYITTNNNQQQQERNNEQKKKKQRRNRPRQEKP
jgi:hypothetical protein